MSRKCGEVPNHFVDFLYGAPSAQAGLTASKYPFIFWSFSAFNQMHAWLSQYRVGALTMKVGRRGRRGVGDDSLFFPRLLATH